MTDYNAFDEFVGSLDLKDLVIGEIFHKILKGEPAAAPGWMVKRRQWRRILIGALAGLIGALIGMMIRRGLERWLTR